MERETDALRLGLERHVAAARELARRARAFGAGGTGIGTKSRHPGRGIGTGTVGGVQGDDVDLVNLVNDWDADGASSKSDARAFEAVYGSLRGFIVAETRSNGGGGRAVSLDDLDARRRAAALDVLHLDLATALDLAARSAAEGRATEHVTSVPASTKRRFAPSPPAAPPRWK